MTPVSLYCDLQNQTFAMHLRELFSLAASLPPFTSSLRRYEAKSGRMETKLGQDNRVYTTILVVHVYKYKVSFWYFGFNYQRFRPD